MVTSVDGEIFPNVAIHPGRLLGEELAERGIAMDAFASEIEWPLEHVRGVIEGRRAFDATFSVALERVLAIPARLWMTRQATYELIPAYLEAEKRAAQRREHVAI